MVASRIRSRLQGDGTAFAVAGSRSGFGARHRLALCRKRRGACGRFDSDGVGSQQGFLLPLASGGALLLLLSCLSLQSLIWGRQLDGRSAWQQRQADDLLSSAAQRVAVLFNRSHRCLLTVPSAAWPVVSTTPAGCDDGVDPAPLLQSHLPAGSVRLVGWIPPQRSEHAAHAGQASGWGVLTLARASGREATPLQRRYRLQLAAEPLRVISVQELDR